MNTQPIPRIVEKANPGFEEFTAANFAEPPQETDEQKNQRTALLEQIKAEQNRLNIDNAMLEFLIHQQTGATRLGNVP
ncbi:MAG TPA: hypothetical protein VK211_15420, partial [Kamptonema sp.]|nr:hypothetical protein [Kamptonema sp.]